MARAELIRNAQTSLDLQYYIVHDGISTRMLVDELLKAADRGVRVRILLTTPPAMASTRSSPPSPPTPRCRYAFSTRCIWAQHRRYTRHGPGIQPVTATPAHA